MRPAVAGDLDVLDPAPVVVNAGGERLEIRPLTVGALPALVRTARPVIDAVLELTELPGEDDAGGLIELLMDLIENHGAQVFEAAALCTGRDVAWVQSLDLGEFTELATTVFEVNRDFFVRRLAPLLAARAAKAAPSGDGPTASSS